MSNLNALLGIPSRIWRAAHNYNEPPLFMDCLRCFSYLSYLRSVGLSKS